MSDTLFPLSDVWGIDDVEGILRRMKYRWVKIYWIVVAVFAVAVNAMVLSLYFGMGSGTWRTVCDVVYEPSLFSYELSENHYCKINVKNVLSIIVTYTGYIILIFGVIFFVLIAGAWFSRRHGSTQDDSSSPNLASGGPVSEKSRQ